jgi:hypothetical protein
MNGLDPERVFGHARLVVSSGAHVEVVREAAAPGERRRYSKRFLAAPDGDFRPCTVRESRVLAHLARKGVRCIPAIAAPAEGLDDALQTFDAGVTLRDWSSVLRFERDGRPVRNVFADAAHWWALAQHALRALDALHVAGVVHLRVAPGNICVPLMRGASGGDAGSASVGAHFARLAFIDFALASCAEEPLSLPLPAPLTATGPRQSPRLARALDAARAGDSSALRALDWRCDLFAVAAVLRRHLLETEPRSDAGWTRARFERAAQLLDSMRQAHDREDAGKRPHAELMARCEDELRDDLVGSLMRGFAVTPDAPPAAPRVSRRIVFVESPPQAGAMPVPQARRERRRLPVGSTIAVGLSLVLAGMGLHLGERWQADRNRPEAASATTSSLPKDVAPAVQPKEALPAAPPANPPTAMAPSDAAPPPIVASTASRALGDHAARMQSDVAQVLAAAARSTRPGDDDKILQAARSMRAIVSPAGLPVQSRATARALNAQARAAWERQDLANALELQQRAFLANPNDPEVTGNLAFFYLKAEPPLPGHARDLALYALGVRGGTFPAGREEDWGTLAIASALEGRESDAMQALYVMFALGKDPERACRAAVLAMAQYGPAMTRPAEAMLSRVSRRGTASSAPSCARMYPR